jgi:S-adenosylmethionine-diacylglycerol 3-amino-3-carboxypropyl transferase
MPVFDWIGRRVFDAVHRNNLVYNTCWEDPRLDREALRIAPTDDVLVITSAGCNALDYALCAPNHVHAVDMNPRQNALLDLKQAGIRGLEFDDFFAMFGAGRLPGVRRVYEQKLRNLLPESSRGFWDAKIGWFDDPRCSFYFRGTSGFFARMAKVYTDRVLKVRPSLERLLAADTVAEQREIWDRDLRPKFSGLLKFVLNRNTTMALLGVPLAQRRQIEATYSGDLARFVQECVEGALAVLPIKDNYFWRVYIDGRYTRECCPEYLVEANFARLKAGLVDRVTTHTDSVQGFLEKHGRTISRFVLLDHMDWLRDRFFPLLESEWQAIVDRAAPHARLIWRSGGFNSDFVKDVRVTVDGRERTVGDLLTFDDDLAKRLHPLDRVHTYGSFTIAELKS